MKSNFNLLLASVIPGYVRTLLIVFSARVTVPYECLELIPNSTSENNQTDTVIDVLSSMSLKTNTLGMCKNTDINFEIGDVYCYEFRFYRENRRWRN